MPAWMHVQIDNQSSHDLELVEKDTSRTWNVYPPETIKARTKMDHPFDVYSSWLETGVWVTVMYKAIVNGQPVYINLGSQADVGVFDNAVVFDRAHIFTDLQDPNRDLKNVDGFFEIDPKDFRTSNPHRERSTTYTIRDWPK
jgi:hypothetical protein